MREIDPTTPGEDLQRLTALAESTGISMGAKQSPKEVITEGAEVVAEKAVSKAQQKLMGQAYALKKGDMKAKDASKEVKKLAKDMSKSDLKDFASTKHKGKPEHVKKENVEEAEQIIKAEKKQKLPSKKSILMMCGKGMSKSAICKEYSDCDQEKLKEMIEACMKEMKESIQFVDMDGEIVEAKSAAQKKAQEKFKAMVKGKKGDDKDSMDESSAKPDFLDIDKDGNKKEPMKKAAKDAKKGNKKTDEGIGGALAGAAAGDSIMGKIGGAYVGHQTQKSLNKSEKNIKKIAKALQNKGIDVDIDEASKKKTVKESVEPKMSFVEMMKLVRESGGQQAIDPLDDVLWSWANRVAQSKVEESTKQEIFAAMVYERNGGRFEMYDVVEKGLNEGKDCNCGPDCACKGNCGDDCNCGPNCGK